MIHQYKKNGKYRIDARCIALALITSSLIACKTTSGGNSNSELDGVWTSTCRSRSESSGATYYEKNTISFSGNSMTSAVRSYSNDTCTTELTDKPLLIGVSTFVTGDFVIGAAGARKFNSQLNTLNVTLTSDAYVAVYNGTAPGNSPVCGGGFVKGQPKQLDATLCASDDKMRSEFATRYDIYKIAGNIVYFGFMGEAGSSSDGSSETKRPVALDPSYFIKS